MCLLHERNYREITVCNTLSFSKNTAKPEYSQRVMAGVPTEGTSCRGAPNFVFTPSIVLPRVGTATTDGDTDVGAGTVSVSPATGGGTVTGCAGGSCAALIFATAKVAVAARASRVWVRIDFSFDWSRSRWPS